MLYTFIDESGTSKLEPMTFVAGISIPEAQLEQAREAVVATLAQHYPPNIPSDHVFHAKDILGGEGVWEHVPSQQRADILLAMVGVARKYRFPVTFGMAQRDSLAEHLDGVKAPSHEVDYFSALMACTGQIGRYVHDNLAAEKELKIVSENIDSKESAVKILASFVEQKIVTFPPGCFAGEDEDAPPTTLRWDRIVGKLEFAKKGEERLLELADACAFAYRRWLAKQKFGDKMVEAMIGWIPDPTLYLSSPTSFETWRPGK